jgi:hypothetical protein
MTWDRNKTSWLTRQWYDPDVPVEEIARELGVTETEVRVQAVCILQLGYRDRFAERKKAARG